MIVSFGYRRSILVGGTSFCRPPSLIIGEGIAYSGPDIVNIPPANAGSTRHEE